VVSDLWAECRRLTHVPFAAILMVGVAVALATTAYLFVAPTAGILVVCALVATLAFRIQHRQAVSGERRGR
jgi:hypothetical protein